MRKQLTCTEVDLRCMLQLYKAVAEPVSAGMDSFIRHHADAACARYSLLHVEDHFASSRRY